MEIKISITPRPAVKTTAKGRFSKRSQEYQRYLRSLGFLMKAHRVKLENELPGITFVFPMAKSWSKKKRKEFDGKRHENKPDLDNLIKPILDAYFKRDEKVSRFDGPYEKVWGQKGLIIFHFDTKESRGE